MTVDEGEQGSALRPRASRAPRVVAWVMAILVVPPLLLLTVAVVWGLGSWIYYSANPGPPPPPDAMPESDEQFSERLAEVLAGDEREYLVSITDVEWTTVSLFTGYGASPEVVEEETGITTWEWGGGSQDEERVWIFCKDGAVVAAITTYEFIWALPGTYGPAVQVVPRDVGTEGLLGGRDGEAEPDCT